MDNFIEEILKNKTFLYAFYNFSHYYKNSDYEENMKDFYNSLNSKINFISKNTDWLFITDDGDCYGTLDKFVVKVDSEGEFSYVCHGFENLAEYLLKDKLNLSNAKYYCKQKNTTLENMLNDYQNLLKKYSINKVILFGSRARGDNTERSDIDIAVYGGDFDSFYWDIKEKVHSLLSFDVVEADKPISEELKQEIEKDGVIIYEKA